MTLIYFESLLQSATDMQITQIGLGLGGGSSKNEINKPRLGRYLDNLITKTGFLILKGKNCFECNAGVNGFWTWKKFQTMLHAIESEMS